MKNNKYFCILLLFLAMRFELLIASRLKLGNKHKAGSPSLNVALVGIILAILIIILSVEIVMGFKKEITTGNI